MALNNPPNINNVLLVGNNAGTRSITGFGSAFTGTAGTKLTISTPNSTGTAAGTDIQIEAGDASTSGAGGHVILLPGNNAGASAVGAIRFHDAAGGGSIGEIYSSGAGICSFGPTAGISHIRFETSGATAAPSFNISMTTSAVNYIQVAGATTGNNPVLSAQGTGTDIDITITPKGAGNVVVSAGLFRRTVTATITASTTQSQGQGALTADINEVATVANVNDTVTMPSAVAGMFVAIINNGANTLQIFPASGDNLGAGVNTSVTLGAGSNIIYTTYNATNWESV